MLPCRWFWAVKVLGVAGAQTYCTADARSRTAGAAALSLPALQLPQPPPHAHTIVQELLGGLWGSGSFKKGEVEAAVQDMLSGGPSAAAHSHSQGEGEAEGCPTCGAAASAVDAEPAAKVYLSLRRLVDEYQLSCITVRCFDVVSDSSTLCMMAFCTALHTGGLPACSTPACRLTPFACLLSRPSVGDRQRDDRYILQGMGWSC